MEKGTLIGRGMTAEVYEWAPGMVLKLFFDRYSEDRIKYEAEITKLLHEAGVPSPAIYGMIDVDGRKGIILERIIGKTILSHIQVKPWKLYYFAQKMAQLHFKIHTHSANNLPSQKERFTYKIKLSSQILGDMEKKVLDYIDSLPNDICVCHGDIHFNNIIVSQNELVAIDWNSAYQGNPLGDVARTALLISSPAMPPGTPNITIMLSEYAKSVTYWTYLNEYMRLAKVKFEDIDAWILPVAAAKLKDKVPGQQNGYWILLVNV